MRAAIAGVLTSWLLAVPPAGAQPLDTPPPDQLPPAGNEPPPPPEEPPPEQQKPPPPPPPPPPVSVNAALYADLPPLQLPPVDADTLAFGSSFRIVAASLTATSSGQLSDGEDDEIATYSLTVDSRYFRSLEKKSFGWSVLASAGESLDRAPAPGGSFYSNLLSLAGSPEARFYPNPGSLFFLHGTVDFATTILSTKQTGDAPASDSNAPGSFGVVIGAGFGRVLNIDPVVRLRRLEQALQARGKLAGAIPQATGTEIIRTWYALRNDITLYRTLAYTMKHLQQSGGLTGDPDLLATYQALQILGDPYIVDRRMGWEMRAGLGIVQPFTGFDDADEPDAVAALLASGQYELPIDTTRQLSLRAKALFDIGDSDSGARPYSLRGFATYTQVHYNEFYDPIGSLAIAGEAGASGLRIPGDDPEIGLDVAGRLAYSMAFNRGSLATAGLNGSLRNDGIYTITLSLGITWGIADGYFTLYTPGVAGI